MTLAIHAALTLACAATSVQEPESKPLFDLHVDPFVEMWCEVRARSAKSIDEDDLFRADELAREMSAQFTSPRFAELFDAAILRAALDPAIEDPFAEPIPLPPRMLADGRTVESANEAARALVRELEGRRERFEEQEWPKRLAKIERARDTMLEIFPTEAQDALAKDAARTLELTAPDRPVPVVLVTSMPEPGGVTLRLGRGNAACLVRATGRDTSTLAEVLVHEALHALVARQRVASDLFDAISTRMALAGAGDPRWRAMAVHTLYFVAAADLVRTHVDEDHEPYGAAFGVYRRAGKLADEALALWPDYRKGDIDSAAFADRLAARWLPLFDARKKRGR